MNDPIDNLIGNMNAYSQPVSSLKPVGHHSIKNLRRNNKSGYSGLPSLKMMKKERAMTAHAKSSQFNAIKNRKSKAQDNFQTQTMFGRNIAPKSAINNGSTFNQGSAHYSNSIVYIGKQTGRNQ